jgi:hypothetical protein
MQKFHFHVEKKAFQSISLDSLNKKWKTKANLNKKLFS